MRHSCECIHAYLNMYVYIFQYIYVYTNIYTWIYGRTPLNGRCDARAISSSLSSRSASLPFSACCSMLQCVAVCCSVLLRAMSSSLSSRSTSVPLAVCCSVSQCVAVWLFCRKWPIKIRHFMTLCHPVQGSGEFRGVQNMRVGMRCMFIFTHTCLGCKAVVCSISDSEV